MSKTLFAFKSYQKAEVYRKQRGATKKTPGWGFKVTPKQRRRLQRTHTQDIRRLMLLKEEEK